MDRNPTSEALYQSLYFLLFYPFGFLVYCTFAALASCQTKPTSLGVGRPLHASHGTTHEVAGPEFGHSAQVLLPHLQVIWERRHSNSKRLFAAYICIYCVLWYPKPSSSQSTVPAFHRPWLLHVLLIAGNLLVLRWQQRWGIGATSRLRINTVLFCILLWQGLWPTSILMVEHL